MIDKENESLYLYAHLGAYHELSLKASFYPEKYMQSVDYCVASGMDVVKFDSITHSFLIYYICKCLCVFKRLYTKLIKSNNN